MLSRKGNCERVFCHAFGRARHRYFDVWETPETKQLITKEKNQLQAYFYCTFLLWHLSLHLSLHLFPLATHVHDFVEERVSLLQPRLYRTTTRLSRTLF